MSWLWLICFDLSCIFSAAYLVMHGHPFWAGLFAFMACCTGLKSSEKTEATEVKDIARQGER